MMKINSKLKIVLIILIGIIIVSSISVYATYNYFAKDIKYTKTDGTEISVEGALNELYNKENDIPYIDNIWSSSATSVNYTYSVEKEGKYLIGIRNSNEEHISGTITTNSNKIAEKQITSGQGFSKLEIVDSKIGDYITINGYNYTRTYATTLNAFIAKIENIDVTQIIASDITEDSTARNEYTAVKDNERILAVAFPNASNRTANIAYSGKYMVTNFRNNNDYIDYAILGKNSKIQISSYGYNWGGGCTFILK